MRYFSVKGRNFDCGLQLGKKMRKEIRSRLKLLKISPAAVRRHRNALELIHQLCSRKYPQYIEELQGYSLGSGADYWQLLLLNCPEFGFDHGCSSIAVNNPSQILLAHNEDADRFEKKGKTALVRFIQKKSSFHSYVYAGELAGNAYNWNSHGVFFTVNYLPSLKSGGVKIPRYFTARALCEAKNLSDAIHILRNSNDASGFHYFIGKKNQILSLEHCQTELSVIEVKGKYYHTNHYIHTKFASLNPVTTNSTIRLERIKELISTTDPLTILFDRKNHPNDIYSHGGDKKRTLSTVVFYPQQRKVRIYETDSLKEFKELKM